MILPAFTIFLEPENPLQFSLPGFRSSLLHGLEEYQKTALRSTHAGQSIHRYPAVLCKQVKNDLVAIGIFQGAAFLRQLAEENAGIIPGENSCRIITRDSELRTEEFGITGQLYEYEILSPWIALNQQNAKKFYDLKGKPARDAFMENILTAHLDNIAKAFDYSHDEPVTCTARVRFIRERIDRENRIVFLGKFTTNLCIPDYLGIGQLVSRGYGTIRKVPAADMQPGPEEAL